MRKILLLMAILLSAGPLELYALYYDWVMVVKETQQEKPICKEYKCWEKTADNGLAYHHIHIHTQGDNHWYYTATPYGYRFVDKKFFIYDFEKKEETLAFDFNLSAGDHFTTFNGMEWEVEAVKDTVLPYIYDHPYNELNLTPGPMKLLTVRTLDGKWSDKWLEGFGSFINHFMILSLENVEYSQTIGVDCFLEKGNHLTCLREINSDPFYGHYSGWLEGHDNDSIEVPPYCCNCYFKNGNVVFEYFHEMWPYQNYSCYYRDGDNIYCIFGAELDPHIDGGEEAWIKKATTFKGLPNPESGSYTIHVGNESYTTTAPTGIGSVKVPFRATHKMYDLQGRPVSGNAAEHGILVKDGRKVWQK